MCLVGVSSFLLLHYIRCLYSARCKPIVRSTSPPPPPPSPFCWICYGCSNTIQPLYQITSITLALFFAASQICTYIQYWVEVKICLIFLFISLSNTVTHQKEIFVFGFVKNNLKTIAQEIKFPQFQKPHGIFNQQLCPNINIFVIHFQHIGAKSTLMKLIQPTYN